MTLPSSGQISMSQVNSELQRTSTQTLALNDEAVRKLAAKASGQIAMSDLHGKSNEIVRFAVPYRNSPHSETGEECYTRPEPAPVNPNGVYRDYRLDVSGLNDAGNTNRLQANLNLLRLDLWGLGSVYDLNYIDFYKLGPNNEWTTAWATSITMSNRGTVWDVFNGTVTAGANHPNGTASVRITPTTADCYITFKGMNISGASFTHINVVANLITRAGNWQGQLYYRSTGRTGTNGLHAEHFFTRDEWFSNIPKRIVVPAGVEIGTNHTGHGAMWCGLAWGGELSIDIYGTISGHGGTANGGVGGSAISFGTKGRDGQQVKVNVRAGGILRAGGGGGGKGGTGGGGTYSVHVREPASGWNYNRFTPSYYVESWDDFGGGQVTIWWNGQNLGYHRMPATIGGWTYHYGARKNWDSDAGWVLAEVARDRWNSGNTNGGAGGNGGQGAGWGQTATSGANGAGGGTNAGAGGRGGNGGAWGNSGAAGATGGNGNRTNGSGGSGGGAAGFYLDGRGHAILTNEGTVQGRVS